MNTYDIEFPDPFAPSETEPYGAIAKIGAKWFWVYWSSRRSHFNGDDPDKYGRENSLESAIDKCGGAKTFTNDPLADVFPQQLDLKLHAKEALEWRSVFAARKRKPNPNASQVNVTEYVYHDPDFWYDDEGKYCAPHQHRILRKTREWIEIEQDCYGRPERFGGTFRVPGWRIRRGELEAGPLYSRRWAGSISASAPEKDEKPFEIAESLAALGFKSMPPKGQTGIALVQRAYRRLCKQTHPDSGGDRTGAAFRRLREHYEIALKLVT